MPKNERRNISAFSDFHVDVDRCSRGIALTVYGARGVLDFSESECLVKVRGGKISVHGSELYISVYENNAIEIAGRIERVCFV
jgi:sporulation protein YqfC